MSALYSLWEKLSRSRKYRESFAASVVKRMIPLQIRVLRKQRDWPQARLATESKLTQGVISRAEDPDYGNLTINTLVRIGSGFDCAFVGRFVPFSELARWYSNLADERTLEVPSFSDDTEFKEPAVKESEPEETFAAKAQSGLHAPATTEAGYVQLQLAMPHAMQDRYLELAPYLKYGPGPLLTRKEIAGVVYTQAGAGASLTSQPPSGKEPTDSYPKLHLVPKRPIGKEEIPEALNPTPGIASPVPLQQVA